MPDTYGVSPQEVRDHAAAVRRTVMARVEKAADAANQVQLGNHEAFGHFLVHVLPPVIERYVGDAAEDLRATERVGNEICDALNAVAENYDNTENTMSDLLNRIQNEGLLRW